MGVAPAVVTGGLPIAGLFLLAE
ncbi:hypothetical protein TIFTF001_054631 [Ficus carica]|nr:hypothetical protein TIFTF001_041510 [Ficus carica]GMN71681.1 hypothetical protein TIFTF001_054631 [Ficus carica]